MKTIIKKILLIYISIVLTFSPSSIVYAASPSGWAFSAYDVATSVVTALKGGASASVAVAKSPISQKIAKGIVGGVIVGAALPLAISQITGIALTSLDWVLDPANNAIKYKDKDQTTALMFCDWRAGCDAGQYIYSTPQAAAQKTCQNFGQTFVSVADPPYVAGKNVGVTCRKYDGSLDYWNVGSKSIVSDYQSIPISTVADKIFDNAKTDSPSASVVNDAVKEYVNEGSADVALDTAKADADATHNCGTGTTWNGSACVADAPTTPDTPFDPTDIIDAIGKVFAAVMSLPDVINTAIDDLLADIKGFFEPVITKFNDFVDWVKQEPPQDDAPRNVPVGQLSDVELENFDRYQKRIYFAPPCPSKTFELSVLGVHISKPVDFSGLCSALETVAPFLLAATYISCAFLVIREI